MTRAKNKNRVGKLKKGFLLVNLFFILLLGLAYVTPFIPAEKWGWLSLLALAYPFIMLINGIFSVLWLVSGSWYAIFSLAALLSGMGHHTRYIKLFSLPDKANDCNASVQVLSYNMRGLTLAPSPKTASLETKIEQLHEALLDLDVVPDIICLQEGIKGDLIAKQFGLENTLHAPKSSLWLLSRFPVVAHGELQGEEINPSCMWADLKTPEGVVRIYNMHLVSNRVTNTTEELIQDMNLQRESTWNNIHFIINRYRHTTQQRAHEARALRAHMADCPYPALIAGDGNDTPLSNTYYILSGGLKDSFKERGSGLSTTYDSRLPLLRIDYFLGSKQIRFKEQETHHIRFSDHYPITTRFCLGPKAAS